MRSYNHGDVLLHTACRYIEAAKAAGVRRFIPSEFGGLDLSDPSSREYFQLLGYK
jgi:hypothetical protein